MRLVIIVICAVMLPVFVCFAQETFTLTTYYPSPIGVYRTLRVLTSDDSEIRLTDDIDNLGNPVIHFIDADDSGAVTRTPAITFQNEAFDADGDASNADEEDVRIFLAGDDELIIQGGRLTVLNNNGLFDDDAGVYNAAPTNPSIVRAREYWICIDDGS